MNMTEYIYIHIHDYTYYLIGFFTLARVGRMILARPLRKGRKAGRDAIASPRRYGNGLVVEF